MDIVPAIALSLVIFVGAIGVMICHVRAWRTAQSLKLDAGELNYRRRRFFCHLQTTALMGLAGAALPLAVPVMRAWPKAGAIYVGVVLLALVWSVVLAFTDMWATRFYYGRLRDRNQLEQTRLRAELRLMEQARTYGASSADAKSNGSRGIGPEQEAD